MRYDVILRYFEAKETCFKFLFPTNCSNVYYLHSLHTNFYFIYDV
jgi:hypothetical protein